MPGGFKVGERVRIESLRSQGILMNLEESLQQVEVMTQKARVRTSLLDIVKVREGEEEKEMEISKDLLLPQGDNQELPLELNVIGLTVEDALPKVDKFIDQALLHGLDRVQIIHGVGSGRLRNAIGKYLDSHRAVKSFTPGDRERGGQGLTIVEL